MNWWKPVTQWNRSPVAVGSNIDLVSHHEEVLDKTSGKFAEQKNIYQQLWCLPKVDGKYIQVCTFTAGGNYGGTCLRGDESLVIKKESDIEPLIVVKSNTCCSNPVLIMKNNQYGD